MKPRRIPARAEKVYTYNLSRNPKNDRKLINDSGTPVNRFSTGADEDKPRTKVNYEYAKNTDPREKVKAISSERASQKKNSTEIFAWGDTDEESESFYEDMQEHEIGDPDHETQKHGHPHKTHTGLNPMAAEQKLLNLPEEKLPISASEKPDSPEKPASTDLPGTEPKSTDVEPLV